MDNDKDKDLEYRVQHPESISSSNEYLVEDGVKVKIKYIVEDLEYREGRLYGSIKLIIEEKRKNESSYRKVYSERLENKLFVTGEDDYFNMSFREDKREIEIKKEYVDHFVLTYNDKTSRKTKNEVTLVPSMLEDTLDNLFSSIKRHYQRDTTGDIQVAA